MSLARRRLFCWPIESRTNTTPHASVTPAVTAVVTLLWRAARILLQQIGSICLSDAGDMLPRGFQAVLLMSSLRDLSNSPSDRLVCLPPFWYRTTCAIVDREYLQAKTTIEQGGQEGALCKNVGFTGAGSQILVHSGTRRVHSMAHSPTMHRTST